MASCQQPEIPLTTTAAQADIGPILEQVPANPRQVVIMRPGPHPPPNAIHQEFLEEQPGYTAGSGNVGAIHLGGGDEVYILEWQVEEPVGGLVLCSGAATRANWPDGWSCGAESGENFTTVGGWFRGLGGTEQLLIRHTPDAVAVVIDLADGGFYVVRSAGSTYSYSRWDGAAPVSFTVFWADGTTRSEAIP